jgi:hypothetical protein
MESTLGQLINKMLAAVLYLSKPAEHKFVMGTLGFARKTYPFSIREHRYSQSL